MKLIIVKHRDRPLLHRAAFNQVALSTHIIKPIHQFNFPNVTKQLGPKRRAIHSISQATSFTAPLTQFRLISIPITVGKKAKGKRCLQPRIILNLEGEIAVPFRVVPLRFRSEREEGDHVSYFWPSSFASAAPCRIMVQ